MQTKSEERGERRGGEGTGRVEEPQNFTHKWEQHVANADDDVDGAAVVRRRGLVENLVMFPSQL